MGGLDRRMIRLTAIMAALQTFALAYVGLRAGGFALP
jgi:hypothetical protein